MKDFINNISPRLRLMVNKYIFFVMMNTNQYILKMMENPVHIAYLEDKKRQKSLVKDQDKKTYFELC